MKNNHNIIIVYLKESTQINKDQNNYLFLIMLIYCLIVRVNIKYPSQLYEANPRTRTEALLTDSKTEENQF